MRILGVGIPDCLLLESLGALRQLANGYAERCGDLLHGVPRRVGVAALDQAERAGGDSGLRGQGFLGFAALVAELAHRLAQGWLRSI